MTSNTHSILYNAWINTLYVYLYVHVYICIYWCAETVKSRSQLLRQSVVGYIACQVGLLYNISCLFIYEIYKWNIDIYVSMDLIAFFEQWIILKVQSTVYNMKILNLASSVDEGNWGK